MYRYRAVRKLYRFENGKHYFGYYIQLERSEKRLEDVTVNASEAKRLVRLLNAGQIHPRFLLSFVSTYIDK